MSMEEIVRKRIAETPFSDKVTRGILKVLLGDLQLKSAKDPKFNDDKALGVVKAIIEGNNKFLAALAVDDPRALAYRQENEILGSFLPNYWSAEQIAEELKKVDLQAVDNVGQAIGVAMKHLKAIDAPVEGQTVREVVAKLRSQV